jgi:hypothetical protein
MRMTLHIDDDVLIAAKELARRHNKTIGQVVSELARRGLGHVSRPNSGGEAGEEFFGFRPLPRARGEGHQ